jgi:hypothetical protein
MKGMQTTRRLRMGRAGGLALATLTISSLVVSATPAGAATSSASKLLAKALKDATRGGWVHEVIHTSTEGHSDSMTNSIGASSGQQEIVADGHHASVLVLGETAYIHGDAKALSGYFGIPSSDIAALTGKWMSVPPTDEEYATVSAAVTLASDFANFGLSGHVKAGKSETIDGQAAFPLTGTFSAGNTKVPATLYVSTGKTPLPIAFRASGHGLKATASWSAWGRAVTLTAPSHPIAAATLGL